MAEKIQSFCCEETEITKAEEVHWLEEAEIIYASSGYMRLRIQNASRVFDFNSGSMAFIKSCDRHRLFPMNGKCAVKKFQIPLSYISMLTGCVMPGESFVITAEKLEDYSEYIFSVMDFLQKEYSQEKNKSNELIALNCASLCMLLLRMYPERLTVFSIAENAEPSEKEIPVTARI